MSATDWLLAALLAGNVMAFAYNLRLSIQWRRLVRLQTEITLATWQLRFAPHLAPMIFQAALAQHARQP